MPLLFIGDMSTLYILSQGQLSAPGIGGFRLLDSTLKVPKNISFIGEIKYSVRQKERYHTVKCVQNKTHTSHCGQVFIRALCLTADQDRGVKRENICLNCSLAINNLLFRNKPLEPLIIHNVESKKGKMMEIVVAALALGNISAAAKLYGISRTTIYNYQRKLGLEDFRVHLHNDQHR